MRKFFLCLLLAACSIRSAIAQNNVVKTPKLSALTQQYLLAASKLKGTSSFVPHYVYKTINNKAYISALLKVTSNVNQSTLDQLGVLIGTKAGSIWTAQIPVEKLNTFIQTPGIDYIALDQPVQPSLDQARLQTHADSALKGINLPMPITGEGVVMGIIDAGFDFTHPTLFDTTNTNYRVKKVWTQKTTGTPPAGFAYGNELTTQASILAQAYDTAILSHGTHVAGIAAGSGFGSNTANSKYRGFAYQSEMVMVGIMPAPGEWAVAGESDIIDGINYIFQYAASVSKPAVVNLSWGATIGPHDGNSLFNQACDALTGPGKIFVCAAGNNGQDTVHLGKTFTATDTSVNTFVTFSPYLDANNKQTWVDIWGDTGKTFCVNIKLYNANTVIDSTGDICLDETTHDLHLIGSNGDTCFLTITTTASEYNDKPHILFYARSKVPDNLCLTTKATGGTVNMWEGYVIPPEGYYGYLLSLGYPWAVSGDAVMTVSDIGCTKSAITVGAYNSKPNYTNIYNTPISYGGVYQAKHLSLFSSIGPTEDNRIKPDITAPGLFLASSVNSYDTSYDGTGSNTSSIVSYYVNPANNRTYYYGMLAGTSMASPCVSGIVGLMLQVNPTLTPQQAKDVITQTAIQDTYTGTLPAPGTTSWGHGKINAYQAVKYLVQQESVSSHNMTPMNCILYPNPNKGTFTLDYLCNKSETLKIEVTNIAGQTVNTQYWNVTTGANSRQFNFGSLPKGLYLTKVSSPTGFNTIKTTIQ